MNHPIEEIILASGSPRRKELLQRIGIPFRVVKSECEEITTKKEPCDVVMELSQQKAFDVYSKLSEAAEPAIALEPKLLIVLCIHTLAIENIIP